MHRTDESKILVLCAITAILLWSSCTKQEGDIFETPIAVPVAVDTVAFLTGCQWHWFANGIDADSNRLLDVGSIKPVTGFVELYNFSPNGDLLDSSFVADTPVYYVKWSWQFGNGKSSLFFLDEKTRIQEAFVIVDLSDTSMVLRPLFSPKGAWRVYRKYVRK